VRKWCLAGAVACGAWSLAGSAGAHERERAASASPWFGAAIGAFSFGERALVATSIGPEFGLIALKRLRLDARVLVPIIEPGDLCRRHDIIYFGYVDETSVYTCEPSPSARFAASLSLGVSLLDSEHWLLSPGVLVARTDVAAHGVFVGGSVPLEWVSSDRFRLGVELGLGAALGQELTGRCRNNLGTCVVGTEARLPNLHLLSTFGVLSLAWI